jgi:hypothetical protein
MIKKILTWLFSDFAYHLYDVAERKFTLHTAPGFIFPSPANLRYLDNANVVPAPQGVQVPFNDEPGNVWLGYDAAQCALCITNYNRTIIICCITSVAPQP